MTESSEQDARHLASQEFKAYLARDIARAMRHESRFTPASRLPLRRVLVIAASFAITLAVGLVWGVRTGFAFAQPAVVEQGTPSAIRALRATPIRTAVAAIACVAPPVAAGPQGVAIIELPPATTKASGTFGAILGMRELPGGKVLVNDVNRHQMKLLDSALALLDVPIDSVPGTSKSYGFRPLPLVRYLGDSSLTVDDDAGTLLMLGPSGEVTRAVASIYSAPGGTMTSMIRGRSTGVDDKGRIIFTGFPQLRGGMSVEERVAGLSHDSLPLVRADLEKRRVDTLASLKSGGQMALMGRADDRGAVRVSRMPVEIVDGWGVLPGGTVGIVRGQDYHVDWIFPDGTRRSSAKLPFDWKRMTDEEKQRLIDSTRAAIEAMPGVVVRPPDAGGGSGGGGRAFTPPGSAPEGQRVPFQYIAPALKDIPDYYPSLRIGAALADLDGNLWILPNTSAQSKNGELVYDVVNPKGDFHRVRLPLGRSIAGFGKGGVVFLQSGDRNTGWTLERTRVPR